MKKIFTTIIISFLFININAQKKSNSTLKTLDYSITGMATQGMFSPSISAIKYFTLDKKKKSNFSFGFGARYTHISAGFCRDYITAPATITTGKTGINALFAKTLASNIDTFGLDKTRADAINVMLALKYKITSKLFAEFNFDLIGLGFGSAKNTYIRSQTGADDSSTIYTSSPSTFNLFKVGKNNLGSINTELCAHYKINNHIKVKLGISRIYTGYTLNSANYINSNSTLVNNNLINSKAYGVNAGIIYHF